MRILVINPNASAEMSRVMREQLEAVRRPDEHVDVVNPVGAPPVIESAQDEAACIPLTLDLVARAEQDGYDAVVIACFSDPGLDAAREVARIPVVGIQESAIHLAAQLGDRFAILTTTKRRLHVRHEAVLKAGLERRLASCPILEIPVADTVVNRDRVLHTLIEVGRRAIEEDDAEVLILGCAGLGDLAPLVQAALDVPVVDPNAAALKLASSLVELGLSHSKVRRYSAPMREPATAVAR
jgi:allantoin racemase